MPTCPKCNGHYFTNSTQEVAGYRYKLNLICCRNCGCVLAAMPYFDAGMIAQEIGEEVKHLKNQVSYLASVVEQLGRDLNRAKS